MKKVCAIFILFFISHILSADQKADIAYCEQTATSLKNVQKNLSPSVLKQYKPSVAEKTKERCCGLYGAIKQSKKADNSFMTEEEYKKAFGCGQSDASQHNSDVLECQKTAESFKDMRAHASTNTLSYYQADQKTKDKCCNLYEAVSEHMKPEITMTEQEYKDALGCTAHQDSPSHTATETAYITTCTQTLTSLLKARKGLPPSIADQFKPSVPQKTREICCPRYEKVYDALPAELKLSHDDYKKLLDCDAPKPGQKAITDMITASTCANVMINDPYLYGVLQGSDTTYNYSCIDVSKACKDSILTTTANMCAFGTCVDVAAHDPAFAAKLVHSTTQTYDPHCTNLAQACDDPLFPSNDLPELCKEFKTIRCAKIMRGVLNAQKYTPKYFDQVLDGIPLADRVACCPLYDRVSKALQPEFTIDSATYQKYLTCNNLPTLRGFSDQYLTDLLSASTCANVTTNDPYLLGVLQGGNNTYNYTCVDVHTACTDPALTTTANMCGLAACIDLSVKDPAFATLLKQSKAQPTYDPHCTNLMAACNDPIFDDHPYPKLCHDFIIDKCIKIAQNMVRTEKHAPEYLEAQIQTVNPIFKKAGCRLLSEIHGITTIPENKLKNYFSCGKPPVTQEELLKTAYILKCKGFINSANKVGPLKGTLIYGGLKDSDRAVCCNLDFVKNNPDLKHKFLCGVRLNQLSDFIPPSTCADITTNDANLYAILQTSKNHYNYTCVDIAKACADTAVTTTTLGTTVCAPGACVDVAAQDANFAQILTTNDTLSQTYDPHCVNLANACTENAVTAPNAVPNICQTYKLFNNCPNLAAGLIADPSQKTILDNQDRTLANNLLCCNTPLFRLYDPAFTQLACKYQPPVADTDDNKYCKTFVKDGAYLKLPIKNTKGEDVTKKVQEECCDTFGFVYYDDSRKALKCGPHKYKPGYHE